MGITPEQVEKAFEGLEANLPKEEDEGTNKSSENDIDNAEGGDLGWRENANPKMSDEANKDGGSNKQTEDGERSPPKSDKKSPKAAKGETGMDELVFKAKCPKCDGHESDKEGMDIHMKSCTGKSMTEWGDRQDEELQAKIEVSAFLKSITDNIGGCMGSMKDAVENISKSYDERTSTLEEQISDVQQSQAKLGIVLKAICETLNIVSNSPAGNQKADTEITKGEETHNERNFETGAKNDESLEVQKAFPGLSDNPVLAKAQITDAMVDMVMKGDLSDTAVVAFETGGFIEPEVASKIQKALASTITVN